MADKQVNTPSDDTRMPLTSADVLGERIQGLRELIPEAFVEGKVDFERLKAALGEFVDEGRERYGLSWAGKADAIRNIQSPSVGTLVPCPEESIDFDTTENLFIEGDNLEVLKLLQKSYYGKVKMIYIDPPYNTGNDFIYPDDFREGLNTYLRYTGQVDDEGVRLTTNAETAGRFHSKWLGMMYARIFLARNLLRPDGILFVSVDDTELANLRILLDEVFGEENFINVACVKAKPSAGASGGGEDRRLKKNAEFLLIYTRNTDPGRRPLRLNETAEETDLQEHIESMREEGKSWKYTRALTSLGSRQEIATTMDGAGGRIVIYQHTDYEMVRVVDLVKAKLAEAGHKDVSQSSSTYRQTETQVYSAYLDKIFRDTNAQSSIRTRVMEALGEEDGLFSIEYTPRSGRNKGRLTQVFYKGGKKDQIAWLSDIAEAKGDRCVIKERISTIWSSFNWNNVSKEGDMSFPNGKKPIAFIQQMLELATDGQSNELIMDFFAGSGSTGHAVYEKNRQDGGNRRFILVQLPELETLESDDFANVADICKERLRRTVVGYQVEPAQQLPFGDRDQEDLGFRVFRLTTSNFKIWDGEDAPKDADALAGQLKLFADHVMPDRGEQDILYELMLKAGLPLTAKIEEKDVAGQTAYSIADGLLLICLANPITQESLRAMAELHPQRVVCLDPAFKGNDQLKTNTVLEMKSHNIEFRTV